MGSRKLRRSIYDNPRVIKADIYKIPGNGEIASGSSNRQTEIPDRIGRVFPLYRIEMETYLFVLPGASGKTCSRPCRPARIVS